MTEDRIKDGTEEGVPSSHERAAWHGLATNPAFPLGERLACALKALDSYEAEVERLRAAETAWRERCVAQDELLICYRVHREPSERLHAELERTRAAIHALAGEVPHGE
jgi:hypothetical protein